MRVASWNVNSVRARGEGLRAWLTSQLPEVVCLQETKTLDAGFPFGPIEALGYAAVHAGQKTYNGVAILSRLPLTEVSVGLGDGPDPEARLIAATIAGIRVHSVYVPNGSTLSSPRYAHKLRWFDRLVAYLDRRPAGEDLLVCGDFNVAPEERDLYNPGAFAQDVIFHADVRAAYRRLADRGLVDTFRLHQQETGHYSWWDYRMLALAKNRGLRIDLILANAALAERCSAAGIDRLPRQQPQPSDHAPIWAEFRER